MKMKQGLYFGPGEEVVREVAEEFGRFEAGIALDAADVRMAMRNVENSVVLSGMGEGENRVAEALEDAVSNARTLAEGFDLFSADRVMIYLVAPRTCPVEMGELEEIQPFMDRFSSDASFAWGYASKDGGEELEVILIASNLKKFQEA